MREIWKNRINDARKMMDAVMADDDTATSAFIKEIEQARLHGMLVAAEMIAESIDELRETISMRR